MKTSAVLLLTVAALFAACRELHAYPSYAVDYGNSCVSCHAQPRNEGGLFGGGYERDDAMSVISDMSFDADESRGAPPADWVDRGELRMFSVEPGETVRLTMQVDNGDVVYAVQLKRLEKEGFSGVGNKLAGHISPDPSWDVHGAGDTTYYTNSSSGSRGHDWLADSNSPVPFTFTLELAADTPPDLYDLEFATAGRDTFSKWYDDEHFYLNVVPEPRSTLVVIGALSSLFLIGVRHR